MRRLDFNQQNSEISEKIITYGEIIVDPKKRKAMVKGTKIDLTPKEFDLLYLFIANPGRSYSREALLNAVWAMNSVMSIQ